jgi:TM2 domain-containing membrane protein YozV
MKKIITTILIISVFVWCIPKISNAEETENVSLGPKETAVLLSVVFPGVGQIYNKQTTKGIVLAGIGAASLIASIVMYNTANKTYDDYEKKGDQNNRMY